MNRPTPDPSQEGSKRVSASRQFPSWEGLGVGLWSQCIRKSDWRLSMNPPGEGPGPTVCRPGPLTRCRAFMVPVHAQKQIEALREPLLTNPNEE